MEWSPSHSEAEVRDAVSNASSLTEALARLGLRPAGGNFHTLRKLIAHYGVSTSQLDPNWTRRGRPTSRRIPLDEILVEGSTYTRSKLKNRLYVAGLKSRRCELCGQDEMWHGRRMALIIDHINGVGDDNRLENLRIVCPNCAATLDTHCGRQNAIEIVDRACLRCGAEFRPRYAAHRYCSQSCGARSKGPRAPKPESRKVERPPYDVLLAEIAELGYRAVGRKHGVSDNAVRKWVRWYRIRTPTTANTP
jgi:hypothetical protein